MLAALVGILLSQSQGPSRYDLGERLKLLDVAWSAVDQPSKRERAVPFVSQAVTAFFSRNLDLGCKSLDQARCVLLDRTLQSGDAITLRLVPQVVEPGQKATLKITWAYVPDEATSVKVRIGREYKSLDPGAGLEAPIEIPAVAGAADSANLRDMGALVTVMVDDEPRNLYVSVVKNFRSRIDRLMKSQNSIVNELAQHAKKAIDEQATMEQDPSILELINLGESLESAQKQIWQIDNWPRVKHRETVFRAALPSSSCVEPEKSTPIDVVLAFHGAGGSENFYFDGYGRGIAVKEALRRGWVFVAPEVGKTCAADVLDWLVNVRKLKIRRLFVIGHSMGTATVLQSIGLQPKPSAGALFAPVVIPGEEWNDTPLFMAVGKQEMGPIAAIATQVQSKLAIRRDSKAKPYENCEHLMVVAEAAKDAFAFLEQVKAH